MQVEAVTRNGFVSERSRRLGGTVALARVVLHILDDASLRGELGEHLGEGAALRVVRREVVVVRMPALPEPCHRPQRHALGKDVELGATRRRRGHALVPVWWETCLRLEIG
jgi:hypothetical protein